MSRLSIGFVLLILLSGCGGGDVAPDSESTRSLTVYSGRNERLIGPLLERFAEQSGIEVKPRYGDTSELTATLMEEGDHSPADLFVSQDAAALGALSDSGRLKPLPAELLERVPQRFRSTVDDWVGLSGRARVVVYNTDRISPEDLPQRLEDVAAPRYRGKFGVAPSNASFQAHMAFFAALKGTDALDALLTGMVENEPQRYAKNSPIVEAVIAGEIDWGLVNHYYLWRALESKPNAPAKNYFMAGGDASSFINVAGVARLSDNPAATELVRFLLSDEAQLYFAKETYEYPLVSGVPASVDLPPLERLSTPEADFRRVADSLEPTLTAINRSGISGF